MMFIQPGGPTKFDGFMQGLWIGLFLCIGCLGIPGLIVLIYMLIQASNMP